MMKFLIKLNFLQVQLFQLRV